MAGLFLFGPLLGPLAVLLSRSYMRVVSVDLALTLFSRVSSALNKAPLLSNNCLLGSQTSPGSAFAKEMTCSPVPDPISMSAHGT